MVLNQLTTSRLLKNLPGKDSFTAVFNFIQSYIYFSIWMSIRASICWIHMFSGWVESPSFWIHAYFEKRLSLFHRNIIEYPFWNELLESTYQSHCWNTSLSKARSTFAQFPLVMGSTNWRWKPLHPVPRWASATAPWGQCLQAWSRPVIATRNDFFGMGGFHQQFCWRLLSTNWGNPHIYHPLTI